MNKPKNFKPQTVINLIALLLIVGVGVYVAAALFDTFKSLGTVEGAQKFADEIRSTGVFGAVILITIQILQVVVAFIPGEFVELAAGVMFGPWLGLLLCLVGLNIGTALIFLFVRWFGKTFVQDNVSKKEFERLRFLNNPRRALIIMFFILLIPGIPKDVLIYPVPLTKIKMRHFMIISTLARIPTIITSTITGSAVMEDNYLLAIILSAVSIVLAALGILFNKRICDYLDKKFPQSPGETQENI